MNLNAVAVTILGMMFVAVVGVATFLALDGLDDNLVNDVAYCGRNSSGGTSGTILYTGCPEGYNATQQITAGVGNVYDLAPTWGTLIGVGVLIGIITGFLFLGAVGYGYGRRKGYF